MISANYLQNNFSTCCAGAALINEHSSGEGEFSSYSRSSLTSRPSYVELQGSSAVGMASMGSLRHHEAPYMRWHKGTATWFSFIHFSSKGLYSWLQWHWYIHRVSIGLVENYGHFTGAWREAAEVVSSMTPNSASVERVFSLLTCMFRDSKKTAAQTSLSLPSCFAARNANRDEVMRDYSGFWCSDVPIVSFSVLCRNSDWDLKRSQRLWNDHKAILSLRKPGQLNVNVTKKL